MTRARIAATVTPALWLVAFALLASGSLATLLNPYYIAALAFYLAAVALTFKVPSSPIGWMLHGFPLCTALALVASGIVARLSVGSMAAAWWDVVSSVLATISITTILWLLLYFPDGELPSPRWRPAAAVWAIAVVSGAGAALLNGGWGGDPEEGSLTSPLRAVTEPWGDVLSRVFFASLIISFAVAAASLIVRYLGASQRLKNQLKWLLLAGAYLVIALVAVLAIVGFRVAEGLAFELALSSGFAAVPLAIALAVTRYRLYDVDRIISRTVTYGLVTALLIGVYLAAVFVFGSLVPGTGNDLVVAGSTLLAAALFTPARERVQRWVDRRFNRSRYDGQRVVDGFVDGLRSQFEFDRLTSDLMGVVGRTLQPASVAIWLAESVEVPDEKA